MLAYIIRPYDGAVLQTVSLSSWDFPLETASGENGSATVAGELNGDFYQCFLRPENENVFFRILGVTGGTGERVLTLGDNCSVFGGYGDMVVRHEDRSFVSVQDVLPFAWRWNQNFMEWVKDSIAARSISIPQQCEGLWKGLTAYTTSRPGHYQEYQNYLDIVAEIEALGLTLDDVSAEDVEIPDSSNLYSIVKAENVARAIQAKGYTLNANLHSDNLGRFTLSYNIEMRSDMETRIPIYFKDGHSEIISSSFSNDVCSTIIMRGNPRFPESDAHYFLLKDGTIQVGGMPDIDDISNGFAVTVKACDDSGSAEGSAARYAQASEIFAQNTKDHKVEFLSDRELHVGQPVLLMLSRGATPSTISSVHKRSGDDRWVYSCGDLPVTASEKIVSNSWDFKSRLPQNPRKGQLVMM